MRVSTLTTLLMLKMKLLVLNCVIVLYEGCINKIPVLGAMVALIYILQYFIVEDMSEILSQLPRI